MSIKRVPCLSWQGRNGTIKRRGSGYLLVAYLLRSHILISFVPVAQKGCCAPKLKTCGGGDSSFSGSSTEKKVTEG